HGTARRHLVARHRGAVLPGLALGRPVLLDGSTASSRDRRDLSVAGAALRSVPVRRRSLPEHLLPPGRPDGRRAARGRRPRRRLSPVAIRPMGRGGARRRGAARLRARNAPRPVAGLLPDRPGRRLVALVRAALPEAEAILRVDAGPRGAPAAPARPCPSSQRTRIGRNEWPSSRR